MAKQNFIFLQYYRSPNERRQNEIDFCFLHHVANPNISRVYIFLDTENVQIPSHDGNKVSVIPYQERITYAAFLKYIKYHMTIEDNNYILVNSDITFDDSLTLLNTDFPTNTFLCLSRWENGILFNRSDSQDTWIIQNNNVPESIIKESDFPLGVPGCDNKIAEIFNRFGYKVVNPSKSIITHHHHQSNYRNYMVGYTIPPPYFLIEPSAL